MRDSIKILETNYLLYNINNNENSSNDDKIADLKKENEKFINVNKKISQENEKLLNKVNDHLIENENKGRIIEKLKEKTRELDNYIKEMQLREDELKIEMKNIIEKSNSKNINEKEENEKEIIIKKQEEIFETQKLQFEEVRQNLQKELENLQKSYENLTEENEKILNNFNIISSENEDLKKKNEESNLILGNLNGERIRIEEERENLLKENENIKKEYEDKIKNSKPLIKNAIVPDNNKNLFNLEIANNKGLLKLYYPGISLDNIDGFTCKYNEDNNMINITLSCLSESIYLTKINGNYTEEDEKEYFIPCQMKISDIRLKNIKNGIVFVEFLRF